MRKSLAGSESKADDLVYLERRVGLFSGVALIVGTMIGSGIFVSPSGLLVRTGSVGVSFIIWLACGLLSLLGECIFKSFALRSTFQSPLLSRCSCLRRTGHDEHELRCGMGILYGCIWSSTRVPVFMGKYRINS